MKLLIFLAVFATVAFADTDDSSAETEVAQEEDSFSDNDDFPAEGDSSDEKDHTLDDVIDILEKVDDAVKQEENADVEQVQKLGAGIKEAINLIQANKGNSIDELDEEQKLQLQSMVKLLADSLEQLSAAALKAAEQTDDTKSEGEDREGEDREGENREGEDRDEL